MKDKIDITKPIHCHLAWFGSELACKECNPVCWENHQMDNPNHLLWCGKKDCPMNSNAWKKAKPLPAPLAEGSSSSHG